MRKRKLVLGKNRAERIKEVRDFIVEEEPGNGNGKKKQEMILLPAPAKPLSKNRKNRLCVAETGQGGTCKNYAEDGSLYCHLPAHQRLSEISEISPYHADAPLFNYGTTLDVLEAYMDGMNEEDRQFILSVYGDASLDSEIALLRLAIRDLLKVGTTGQKFSHLPRMVSALSDAFREAVRMIEGNRLVVEFTTRNGEEYWRELFRTFQRLLEESVATRLCPRCRDMMMSFVQGGVTGDSLEDVGTIVADV